MGTHNIVTIIEVRAPKSDRRPYVIIDSDGTKYATKNCWLASLAQRMYAQQVPVYIHGGGGWWYRELSGIVQVPKSQLPQEAS